MLPEAQQTVRIAEPSEAAPPDAGASWLLVRSDCGHDEQQVPLDPPFPFTIGRRPGSSLQLNVKTISGSHASLHFEEGQLWVTDLGSTNGTYVNGHRIDRPIVLAKEDLLQFADIAFRVKCEEFSEPFQTMHEDVCDQAFALVQFDRMMDKRLVTPFYQPVVDLASGAYRGYEVLARSRVFGLETCAAMFNAAARLSMEIELSRMLRWEGIRQGLVIPNNACLFVNTHPLELRNEGLVGSMSTARQLSHDVPIILEVHEAAITDPREMRELRLQLAELDIGLAYDDFGAGQTRLTELVEAPPDYLKFDISLIREIDKASAERQNMLASLVKMVLELGVNPLAEGVETAEEADVCRSMGFLTAQGYHFGRPSPVSLYQ